MATLQENLITVRNQIAANLVTVTASPKPMYTEDGASYDWAGYVSMLMDKLRELDEAIQRADGPFEVRSYGG